MMFSKHDESSLFYLNLMVIIFWAGSTFTWLKFKGYKQIYSEKSLSSSLVPLPKDTQCYVSSQGQFITYTHIHKPFLVQIISLYMLFCI